MAIEFDRVNRWVIPDTDTVTIQELYNAITDYQDEPGNMDLGTIASASGKDDLGGGLLTGVTLTMNASEGWTIRWAPRVAASPAFVIRKITGGNLAEVNGQVPITPSDGNTVVVQGSTSASIIEVSGSSGLTPNESAQLSFIEAVLRNKTITDPITGVMTIYATDGVTPLYTAQLYEGTDTSQTYQGQGAERRERLT